VEINWALTEARAHERACELQAERLTRLKAARLDAIEAGARAAARIPYGAGVDGTQVHEQVRRLHLEGIGNATDIERRTTEIIDTALWDVLEVETRPTVTSAGAAEDDLPDAVAPRDDEPAWSAPTGGRFYRSPTLPGPLVWPAKLTRQEEQSCLAAARVVAEARDQQLSEVGAPANSAILSLTEGMSRDELIVSIRSLGRLGPRVSVELYSDADLIDLHARYVIFPKRREAWGEELRLATVQVGARLCRGRVGASKDRLELTASCLHEPLFADRTAMSIIDERTLQELYEGLLAQR